MTTEPDRTALRTPPALPPRWVDARPLVGLGTVLWFLAFCGLLLARFGFAAPATHWLWVCLSGWVLGLVGFAVMYWQRAAARRGARGAQRL